jgi:HEAT repeat protein
MNTALVIVTGAIVALGAAVVTIVLVLVVRRMRERTRDRHDRKVRERLADQVARVAGGERAGAGVPGRFKPGAGDGAILEELLCEARRTAEPDAARHIARYLDEGGFTDHALRQLSHGDRFARASAALRLAEHGSPRALPALVTAVSDPERDVRTAAVRALGAMGGADDGSALTALARVAERVAEGGAAGAGAEGGSVVAPRVLWASLARFGPGAARVLAPMLVHPAWRVRSAAAYLLGEVGAAERIPDLIERVADLEPDVRAKAAQALGRLEAHSALFPLLGRLEDAAWLVRMHAVRALGALGEETAAEPVARRLYDPHWRVRQEAGAVLARLGGPAVDLLTHTLLTTEDGFARQQVVEELQRTPVLSEAIDRVGGEWGPDGVLAGSATRLLTAVAEVGAHGRMLAALADHADPRVRTAMARLLGEQPGSRITSALARAAAHDPDPSVQAEAARHLEQRAPGVDAA